MNFSLTVYVQCCVTRFLIFLPTNYNVFDSELFFFATWFSNRVSSYLWAVAVMDVADMVCGRYGHFCGRYGRNSVGLGFASQASRVFLPRLAIHTATGKASRVYSISPYAGKIFIENLSHIPDTGSSPVSPLRVRV